MPSVRWPIGFLFCVAPVWASPPAEDDPDAAILALTESKIFQKKEYPAVRAAFAKRFEHRHADDLRSAFGDDYEKLTAWLAANPDIRDDLYTAFDEPGDHVPEGLKVFHDIWKAHADKLRKHSALAIAAAVAWDRPREGLYDWLQHQRRTRSFAPERRAGAVEVFEHLARTDTSGRLAQMPWECLVHVVDHDTPIPERDWAVRSFGNRRSFIGRCYHDVKYDYDMLNHDKPHLEGKPYTLDMILAHGGVCAMQADFSARVAKSIGVPAAYVWGEADNGGLHAWVMWVEVRSAAKGRMAFTLESHGRYFYDNYYVGTLRDPRTGRDVTDRELEVYLFQVATDPAAHRHARMALTAYRVLCDRRQPPAGNRFAYLEKALPMCPTDQGLWTELAAVVKGGGLEGKHRTAAAALIPRLFTVFARHPDLTWRFYTDLAGIDPDPKRRIRDLTQLVGLYDRTARPDLTCEAVLKLADLFVESGKPRDAIMAMGAAVKRFPGEGRYVPKLLDRIEKLAESFPKGPEQVMLFYLEFLPTVPKKRGDEVTSYALTVQRRGARFFREHGQAAKGDQLEAEIANWGGSRPGR